jgi:3-hydroxyacyl-[acyl-carrier-protein] dehydratase
MLENSFYTVEKIERAEDSLVIGVLLDPSHDIYKAHFPGNPITPGVCLLQIALELLDAYFKRNLRLVEAKNIKYLKVINPLENPEIEFNIKYKLEGDLILVDYNIVAGETLFTKVSATYKGL